MTGTTKARALLLVAVVAIAVAADQAVKATTTALLANRAPVVLAGGFVQLRCVENRGAMLSLGSGMAPEQRRWAFTIVECAILAALAVWALVPRFAGALEFWAVTLIAGGAAGNILDRVRFGYVRDYVLAGIDKLPTAAFNLADVVVVAGAVLIVVDLIASRRKARRAS